MEHINYLTNTDGEKTAIQINLIERKNLTMEEIEEIEDIVTYELINDEESLDFSTEIDNIINKKSKKLYNISIKKSALKQLEKLPIEIIFNIKSDILELSNNPLPKRK